MKNISFFKKLKLFFLYRKTIKQLRPELGKIFNARIDNAYRIYTVINVTDELITDDNYSLDSKYLESVTQKTLKTYTNNLTGYLNSKGLNELYEFYNIEVVDQYSYLVIYGFSLFKSDIFYKRLYRAIPIIIGTATLAILLRLIFH